MSAPVTKSANSYFTWAYIVTLAGLVLGAWLGWQSTGTLSGMATIFFICAVLAVLEISLSFDNAIVNANKLKDMTPVWQHRFLTWGILIAIGLGIGAMYVRSMTIMLVDKGTLAEYRYLEHGAFYAILILSVIMYCQTLTHIPEVITGLGGAGLIGISLWSSIRYNRKERENAPLHEPERVTESI